MTELETLERAKMYMEKLANGINPLDGSLIPEAEVVNNVRLSRCFFYVADVLGKVIDHGGTVPQKKEKRPFVITPAQRRAFVPSVTPIPISELAKQINALADEDMVALSYTAIRDWLMSLGMLEEVQDGEGKKMKRPTARGESIGISQDTRIGANGTYVVVVYHPTAQQFVLDNLDAVLEFERERKENQGKPWNPEQDSWLLDLHQKGSSVNEIAVIMKRNPGAVRARLKKLGVAI